MPWSSRYAVRTFFGTHMHQASMSSSRSSSTSSTGSRARTHWYRSSLGSGIMNVSGRLATAAAGPMTIQDRPRVLVRQAGDITLSVTLGSLSSLAASALRAFSGGLLTRGTDTRLSLTCSCYALNNKDYAGDGTSG